jgi:thiamine biosynthesis lipoprotein
MPLALHHFPFSAMASPCALQLYAESRAQAMDAAQATIAEIARIEAKYTRYSADSLTAAINRSSGSKHGIAVDEETATLLDYAETAYTHSDGLFDITSGVLREVWDFRSNKLPTQRAVLGVLQRVGWHKVEWSRPQLRMRVGMQLDFGGYGKEYAADRAVAICRQRGVRFGIVDLGGDVAIVGPHPNGTPWRVGIRDSRGGEAAIATIPLTHGAIATSGDYQRCMWVDGKRYAHILDARSGWPVADGLASVSIVADHCLVAGTASTIGMLRGSAGARWLDDLGLPNLRIDQAGRLSGTLTGSVRRATTPAESAGAGCYGPRG